MKKALTTYILALIVSLPLSAAWAGIIFQDDFESDSSTWTCSQGQLSKWSSGYMACGSTSGFGPEWKMGPGHNSKNAVYAWKKSGVPNGYRTESQRWLTGSDVKREIYHRWYMKVPPAAQFNKTIGQGFKFWRYITRANGFSGPSEVYLNVRGGSFATGNLTIYSTGQNATGRTPYLDLVPISSFNDNQWHCHELRIKINTAGQADGVIQYWLDGVLKATHSNLMLDNKSGQGGIHRIGVGIGNVSDSAWNQSDWSAVAFDDIVVSTDYVGPKSGSTTPTPDPPVEPNPPTGGKVLFEEKFEDTAFGSRGWYDNTGGVLSSTEKAPGSTRSLEMRFRRGDTGPYGGVPRRLKFAETDSLYISYWVKYSANWQGQPASYDHHEFYIQTNEDSDYSSLAWNRLTVYLEQNHGKPVISIQDSANINTSYIRTDITSRTENRAVAGCNGDSDGYGSGDCYQSGNWYNGKDWTTPGIYFSDNAGQYYKSDWHHVEVFLKLNTISNGKANKDGQIKYWYDEIGRAHV